MYFETFKKELNKKGSEHIISSLEILGDLDNHNVFLIRSEDFRVQLETLCKDILTSFGSKIDTSKVFKHPTMHHPMNGIELLNLHYFTVYPIIRDEFTEKVQELYTQKYPNLPPEEDNEA